MTIISVYVDDLVVMSSSFVRLSATKKALSGRFKMKDTGPLHYCLGVSVVQNEDGAWTHQKPYILQMLRKLDLMDAKPVSTPADPNIKRVRVN